MFVILPKCKHICANVCHFKQKAKWTALHCKVAWRTCETFVFKETCGSKEFKLKEGLAKVQTALQLVMFCD